MGIDPLTHKPTDVMEPQQLQNHQEEIMESPIIDDDDDDKGKLRVVVETEAAKVVGLETETQTPMLEDSFCTDEVPLIDPSEIIVQTTNWDTSTSISSSSSSSSSTWTTTDNIFQDLLFPSLESGWSEDVNISYSDMIMDLLERDDFNWEDLLIIDDDGHSNRRSTDIYPVSSNMNDGGSSI